MNPRTLLIDAASGFAISLSLQPSQTADRMRAAFIPSVRLIFGKAGGAHRQWPANSPSSVTLRSETAQKVIPPLCQRKKL